MLIILSGPPAAGKSTVGEELAKKFTKSVYFSVDTIRHFVKGGYVQPWEDTGQIGQGKLAREITEDIIHRYVQAEYVVIIDDVLGEKDVKSYQEKFPETFGFLLLPSLEVLKERDRKRKEEDQMGNRIDELHLGFTQSEHNVLEVIDSSNMSPEETVQLIFTKVKK